MDHNNTIFLIDMIAHYNQTIDLCNDIMRKTTHPDIMHLCRITSRKALANASELGTLLPQSSSRININSEEMIYLYPKPNDYTMSPSIKKNEYLDNTTLINALIDHHRVEEDTCSRFLKNTRGALWSGICYKKIREVNHEIDMLEALKNQGSPFFDSTLLHQAPPTPFQT